MSEKMPGRSRMARLLREQCRLARKVAPDAVRELEDAARAFKDALRFGHAVLSFSHADYLNAIGGTEKVILQEQELLSQRGISYIHAFGVPGRPITGIPDLGYTVGVNVDGRGIGEFSMMEFMLLLLLMEAEGGCAVLAVHIHHLLNHVPGGVRFLINVLDPAKVRFFQHDYYSICPQFNLMKNDRQYCGVQGCGADCSFYEARKVHYPAMKEFFRGIERVDFEVISPSQAALDVWLKGFAEYADRARVVPHLLLDEAERPREGAPVGKGDKAEGRRPRIAYLGYESVNKGIEVWWRLVADKGLCKRYDFYHLGAAGLKQPGVKYVPVSFLEQGQDAMIKALREHGIDIAFLWSPWPETYSFTLHEALVAGCFVITCRDSGNIAARIEGGSRGVVLEDEKELFSLLRDERGLKEMLARFRQENPPLSCRINSQIPDETAGIRNALPGFFSKGGGQGDGAGSFGLEEYDLFLKMAICERARRYHDERFKGATVARDDFVVSPELRRLIIKLRQWLRGESLSARVAGRVLAIAMRAVRRRMQEE